MRSGNAREALAAIGEGRTAVWLRPAIAGSETLGEMSEAEVDEAVARLRRFEPVLAALFAGDGWDGRVMSDLIDYSGAAHAGRWMVKADHMLPMTGSIKARGGVHELLCFVERIARDAGLVEGDDYRGLLGAAAAEIFAQHGVIVASTGNLGYSIGLVARRFKLAAEIHMSHDAKAWKKDRLRALGAVVIEHPCDYSETVSRARSAAADRPGTLFVDDERSRALFAGYAAAGRELAAQLVERGIVITADRRLVVYLPCGVGGAPGGITQGLKAIFGSHVICVFVEPIASACMLVALASGAPVPPPVYDFGGDNVTIADGLAVPRASELALAAVGGAIDAAVAVSDDDMVRWMAQVWDQAGLRLEPSAAAAFAAFDPLTKTARRSDWPPLRDAVHLFWATGGSRLPDAEFFGLLAHARTGDPA